MNNNDFDFGFTTISEASLKEKEIIATKNAIDQQASEERRKSQIIYNMILPLLENLKKDSDTNEYIYWPNRKKIIDDFIKKLEKTLKSQ